MVVGWAKCKCEATRQDSHLQENSRPKQGGLSSSQELCQPAMIHLPQYTPAETRAASCGVRIGGRRSTKCNDGPYSRLRKVLRPRGGESKRELRARPRAGAW